MSGETIFARIISTGPDSSTVLTNVTIAWELTQVINGVAGGQNWFAIDPADTTAQINLNLKNQLADYVTLLTGQTFVQQDVHGDLI